MASTPQEARALPAPSADGDPLAGAVPIETGRARAFGLTFAANLTLAAVNAATGILAARLLGPTGRGELAAIQLWPTFLSTLALLGLPDSLVYFGSRDRSRIGRSLATATAMALAAAAVLMVAGFALLGVVLPDQSDAVVRAARIYLVIVPVLVLAGLPFHVLRATGAFGLWNAIRIAPTLLWLVILVATGVAGSAEPGTLSRWHLAAAAAMVVPIGWLTLRRVRGPYRPDRALVRPLLRYGLPSMATSIPQVVNLRLDQMAMAAVLPSRDLGFYVAAVAWSSAVSPLLTAVGNVLFPTVASQEDPQRRLSMFAEGSRVTVLLALLTVAAVGLLTWPAMTLLFGPEFRQALAPALVLVVASGVLGLGFVLEEGLRGMGQPGAVLRAELAGMAASAVGLAVLLPVLGIVGAALASALAYSLVVFHLVRGVVRSAGVSYGHLLRPTGQDVALLRRGLTRTLGNLRRS